MERLKYRCWEIEYDPEATRKIYDKAEYASYVFFDSCYDRNFNLSRDTIYPKEIMDLFTRLGIDYKLPVEIVDYNSEGNGMRFTGGWFHFVGRIIYTEIDRKFKLSNILNILRKKEAEHLEDISDSFSIKLSDKLDLPFDEFKKYPSLQIGFYTPVPWLLKDHPEPK